MRNEPQLSVDIVIPQYCNWDVTERCLDSLRECDSCVRNVIVVDDASPDDAGERLLHRDGVTALVLAAHHGFAGACNAGAARATADAILFLNNDTIVPAGAIARLVAEFERDPGIGAVGPRLLYADGTVQGAGGGLMDRLDQLARIYQHLDAATPQVNVARDELGICGAALLIRRRLFEAIGGFDEEYKMGFEDTALGLEVWARGMRCRYVPDATIIHVEACSRGRSPNEEANAARFTRRWEGKLDAVPRYRPHEPPCLAIRWHDREPVDALVRASWQRMLRAHAGARVSFAGNALATSLARILAAADKRALMRIAYGASGGADARWIAPRDAADARAVAAAPRDGTIWVPSHRARRLIAEAGIDDSSISVTHLGFQASAAAERSPSTVVITARDVPPERVDAIRRAAGSGTITAVDAAAADDAALGLIRAATTVVFACHGDAWGFLGGEALANGALVVGPSDAPFFEAMPPDTFVGTRALDDVAEAVADVRGNRSRYEARGERARRESARRLPVLYAAERVRELARAMKHGVPDALSLAITPAVAATIRR